MGRWSRPVMVFLCLAAVSPLPAQQGQIVGRVINATTLVPVGGAAVRVVDGSEASVVTSESDGSYQLDLPAGEYDLLVEATGFAPERFDRIRVFAGQITTENLRLESRGFVHQGFLVTPSREALDASSRRSLETEATAPTASHLIRRQEVTRRPTPTAVDHVREAPGVDIGTLGLQSANVVVRGFNNIFSGALHMLADYRLAGLPALRVNYLHFLPLNDHDIDRVEVVLGPGSALYGPNTANGVVHVITRSPLESPGTTVSLAAGERSTVHGTVRSAHRVNDQFAVKISGEFLRGEEWPYADPVEVEARDAADADPSSCALGRAALGLTPAEALAACDRTGRRDFGIRRYEMEGRADWRFSDRGSFVGTLGVSDVSGIELTGLGAVQAERWAYHFVQARLSYDRWAIQAYVNLNDSGDTFLLRNGTPLVDRSSLSVVQLQNGFDVFDGRQDFTYGFDYFATRPESGGTIYGDYESDNDIEEWGIYLQSRTALTSGLELTLAGRVDSHSILPEKIFSPRAALVFSPGDDHTVRFAYNRAFSTPTGLNYFLDLGAGPVANPELARLGYTGRAFGTGRDGFTLQDPDGSLRGMRSPFTPVDQGGPGRLLPADPGTLWSLGLPAARLLLAGEGVAIPDDVLAVLQSLSPGLADVSLTYRGENDDAFRPLSELRHEPILPIREYTTETFELGWTGVFADVFRVSIDGYYRTQNGFVSPLTLVTPLLGLDGAGVGTWLASAYVPARVDDLVGRGLSQEAATAQATAEAAGLGPALAEAFAQLPVGVASSDVRQMENGGADLIATYRNIDEDLGHWGADVVLQWLPTPEWSVHATYSHVSRNWFRVTGGEPLALNAPRDKGTLGVVYRNEARGWSASARLRATGSFPFSSTDYKGTRCVDPDGIGECVAASALVDVTLGYRIPDTAATLQLGISNLLDTEYRSFVGAPAIGRLAMVRVRYDLR